MSRIAALVLAAGASSRMGSPKALLALSRTTFLRRVIDTAHVAGAAPVIVVLGHHAAEIQQRTPLSDVLLCANPSPERGMLSSLKAGLLALTDDPRIDTPIDAVLSWPVDHPLVRASTVRALIEAHAQHPGKAIVPRFEGRGGHPTLFPRTLFVGLMALPDEVGARGLFERQPQAVLRIDVDDPGVTHDIDTPADYVATVKTDPDP